MLVPKRGFSALRESSALQSLKKRLTAKSRLKFRTAVKAETAQVLTAIEGSRTICCKAGNKYADRL